MPVWIASLRPHDECPVRIIPVGILQIEVLYSELKHGLSFNNHAIFDISRRVNCRKSFTGYSISLFSTATGSGGNKRS
jgi:hypothetical protein